MASLPEPPEQSEASARKIALEIGKLELEQQSLRRQLSSRGQVLEWLKAASVPIAILGALVSLYIGTRQGDEAREKRLTDMYDSAFSQLSSTEPPQRISAAMRLNLFLADARPARHAEILSSLVGALSVEQDALVQDAILDVLENAAKKGVQPATLNEILGLAIQRDRSLLAHELAQLAPKRDRADMIFPRAPDIASAASQIAGPELFKSLRANAPLGGMGRAISGLVAEGARASDFSRIYCQACDFSPLKTVPIANFSGSFLPDARLEGMVLRSANFTDVHLSATRFTGTDLQKADFSETGEDGAELGDAAPPIFACADMRGAKLDGLPLLRATVEYYGSGGPLNADIKLEGPRLDQAKTEGMSLTRLKIVHTLRIAGSSMREAPTARPVADALRHIAIRLHGSQWQANRRKGGGSIEWTGDTSYVARDVTILPLYDNALGENDYLSVASVFLFAADNRITDVERRFHLLARNVNASDPFFNRRHGRAEGEAQCASAKPTASDGYLWYIFTDFDDPAIANRYLSAPFNPM